MTSALTFTAAEPAGGLLTIMGRDHDVVVIDVALSSTYATGGVAFSPTATNAGLVPANSRIDFILFTTLTHATPGSAGHTIEWDSVNNKAVIYVSGGTEFANGGSLTGMSFKAVCFLKR